MKKSILRIISLFILLGTAASAAEVTPDYLMNTVYEKSPDMQIEPKKVRLFKKRVKDEAKTVEREKTLTKVTDDEILTDEDFIKKLRKTEKFYRKDGFEIRVKAPELTGSVEAGEDDGYYGGGDEMSPDPKDKKFLKKFRKKSKSAKNAKTESGEKEPSQMILTSDTTDYYPERNEVESVGHAKLEIKGEDFILYADKIIFNHDINSVRAYDNVKIVKGGNVTTGDFINIDMNTAHGWIQKPNISNYAVKIKADEAYVYPDKIEQYDGVMNIAEDRRLMMGSTNFTNMINPGQIDFGDMFKEKETPGKIRIKAKHIDVDSKEGHNMITLRHASIYYKKFKLATVPSFKIATDKEQTTFETNIPEFGNMANVGMYAGPSVLLDLPLSTVLKLSPIAIYSQDEGKFGIGGIATIHNKSNYTRMAYGSAENKFLLQGYQRLTDKLDLRYSQNMYTSQWFMGFRRPMYSAELVYDDSYFIEDLGMKFRHQIQAGYYSDYERMSQGEGRLRWMTQSQRPLFSYTNSRGTFNAELGLIGQTSVAQYTSGDTFALARLGPILSTSFKNWNQSLVYYQTAVGGQTPFAFDDYYYGKSNLQIVETLRINKYLTLGYLVSLALGGRNSYVDPRANNGLPNAKTNDMLQENMFLVSVGPESAKFTLGYDAFRQTTALYFSMMLGTKDMDIEFEKASVNNPDTLGNKNKGFDKLKTRFEKVKHKVFPATDPDYDAEQDKIRLLQEKNAQRANDEDEDYSEEFSEVSEQLKNQLAPYMQTGRSGIGGR